MTDKITEKDAYIITKDKLLVAKGRIKEAFIGLAYNCAYCRHFGLICEECTVRSLCKPTEERMSQRAKIFASIHLTLKHIEEALQELKKTEPKEDGERSTAMRNVFEIAYGRSDKDKEENADTSRD